MAKNDKKNEAPAVRKLIIPPDQKKPRVKIEVAKPAATPPPAGN